MSITVDIGTDRYRDEYHAEIEPKHSIRIFGIYRNLTRGPKPFDKTFRIGDWVEYDSYNMSYTGQIVAIGAKTVTVAPYGDLDGRKRRLDLYEFCWRNWDFDREAIAKRNSEWSD